MNTYHVYLRKGGSVTELAWGFTEAKREGRLYFHPDEKKQTKGSFYYLRDIAGVHMDVQAKGPTMAEVTDYIDSLPSEAGSTADREPNQMPEPTSGSVTPRAASSAEPTEARDARVAPLPPVAHR